MYLLKNNINTTTMKTNVRFTFLIVKLIPFALLSQLRSLASSESNMAPFFTSSLHHQSLFFSLTVAVLFNRLHRVYAVWFQSSDFAFFTTSVRFSTNTLAYLTYKAYKAFKAFMAFKRSRLNLVQNYRSVTSFSVDWPRTMRLVYASVSILSVCAIMLWVIVIQTR